MFQLLSIYGLPCVLFTITPEDSINFRIRVIAKDINSPVTEHDDPDVLAEDKELFTFVTHCASLRSNYPGLCAIDFEILLNITIKHILGWDIKNESNIKGVGMFGDLDAFSLSIEEQGR